MKGDMEEESWAGKEWVALKKVGTTSHGQVGRAGKPWQTGSQNPGDLPSSKATGDATK